MYSVPGDATTGAMARLYGGVLSVPLSADRGAPQHRERFPQDFLSCTTAWHRSCPHRWPAPAGARRMSGRTASPWTPRPRTPRTAPGRCSIGNGLPLPAAACERTGRGGAGGRPPEPITTFGSFLDPRTVRTAAPRPLRRGRQGTSRVDGPSRRFCPTASFAKVPRTHAAFRQDPRRGRLRTPRRRNAPPSPRASPPGATRRRARGTRRAGSGAAVSPQQCRGRDRADRGAEHLHSMAGRVTHPAGATRTVRPRVPLLRVGCVHARGAIVIPPFERSSREALGRVPSHTGP